MYICQSSKPFLVQLSLPMYRSKYIKLFLYLCIGTLGLFISCQKEDDTLSRFKMRQFIGQYEGTATHWHTFISTSQSYTDDVKVQVEKGEGASLTLNIIYNHKKLVVVHDAVLSKAGSYSSSTGYGSLSSGFSLSFTDDSLHYGYNQKCGIPCSEGVYFTATKIK